MNPVSARDIDGPLEGILLDGRYLLQTPIAIGGMSTVYRGLDTRLDRPVAVKVMESRYAGDQQFLTRFKLEARTAARLSEPGLVAVYDQGLDGKHPFLVMELVEGGTLRELLRNAARCRRTRWSRCCGRCCAGWPPRTGRAWCTATSNPRTC